VVARLALEHKLRTALERQQFVLHYQPKVNIRTRRMEGVEALLRWQDPDTGLVPPGKFLAILESTALIVPVGEWILEQALRDRRHWMELGLPAIRVAVNISPVQLRHTDFLRRFLELADSGGTAGGGVDIEITEGALLEDSPAELKKLQALRARGVHVAIDDFGTGYSSLSRLSELPIDTLKIDRSFIQQLTEGRAGRQLVATIIELARTFGMTTVAEGVETQDQLDALWHLGCDQSQGFLHSKAVVRDELATFLRHGRGSVMLPAEAAQPTPLPGADAVGG
jgi:EAL domain-containing protein (putative c-di-GMP-specific phosphodiesterase class I)